MTEEEAGGGRGAYNCPNIFTSLRYVCLLCTSFLRDCLQDGDFNFLFPPKSGSNEWNLGYGKNWSVAKKDVRAFGDDNEPPETGWTYIKSGRKWKTLEIKKQALVSSLSDTEKNNGSATLAGGALCLSRVTGDWIMLSAHDSRMCNSVDDCEEGWDEDCLNPEISKLGKIVISGGESKVRGVYTLENEETCGLFYRRFDGLGYIRFESLVNMWSTWS